MSYIIVDIDGTVADITHRLHHVKVAEGLAPNWDAFFDDCHNDTPITNVCNIVNDLHDSGHQIIFVSGRSDRVRSKTMLWIQRHVLFHCYIFMRKAGDHRPDEILKTELLDQAQQTIGFTDAEILCVIDDRKRVVDMWRKRGLLCLQVAEGDF